MIKLTDLLKLNAMKYSDKIKSEHQKKMNIKTKLISDEMRVPVKPFPENSSRETRKELESLIDYNGGVINESFVKSGDDIDKVFGEYCKNKDVLESIDLANRVIQRDGPPMPNTMRIFTTTINPIFYRWYC